MDLLSFFESFFCASKIAKINQLEERVKNLENDLRIMNKNYADLMEEHTEMIQNMTLDKLELLQQVKDLNALLASSVIIPDISSFVNYPTAFNAFDNEIGIPLGIIADETYYAFSLEQWKKILTPIQIVVKNTLKKWNPDISDCDDWALVLNGFVVTAFVKTGLTHQGALLFARSRTHAYNVFIAYDDSVFTPYIYEPQNNTVIGKLSEVDYEPYVTIKGWLLGAELPPF